MAEDEYLTEIAVHDDMLRAYFALAGQRPQVAFAAIQAERLLPLYKGFVGADTPSSGKMMEGVEAAWRWLETAAAPDPGLREDCFRLIPDTEDHPDELGHAASNAGSAIVGALDLTHGSDAISAISIGDLVIELYDAYAGQAATREEIDRQKSQVAEISELYSSSNLIARLRERAANEALHWSQTGLCVGE